MLAGLPHSNPNEDNTTSALSARPMGGNEEEDGVQAGGGVG